MQKPDGLPQTVGDRFGKVVCFQVLEGIHQALQGVLVSIFDPPQAEQLEELLAQFTCLPRSLDVLWANLLPRQALHQDLKLVCREVGMADMPLNAAFAEVDICVNQRNSHVMLTHLRP